VAAGFGNMGHKRLVEVLEQDPRFSGRKVEMLRYAVSAMKQPQQVTQLAYLFSIGLKIDAVINLDGFNEVAIGNKNAARGFHPAYPSVPDWTRMATDWTGDTESIQLIDKLHTLKQRLVDTYEAAIASPLRWSALYCMARSTQIKHLRWESTSCQGAFVERVRQIAPQNDRSVTGPKFEGSEQEAVRLSVLTWMESSISIESMCAVRGVQYLHVLQPTLLDSSSKVPTPEETAGVTVSQEWVRGVELGYPLLRKAGRRLRERGVNFLDASRVFLDVKEHLYTDACHFNRRGNVILAEAIGQAFLRGM